MTQFIVLICTSHQVWDSRTRVNGEGRLVTTSSFLGSGLMIRMNQDSPISTSDMMEMESTEVVLFVLMLYSFVTELMQPEQLAYNNKTSRARVVVENAFGRLKGRWRCLMKRNAARWTRSHSRWQHVAYYIIFVKVMSTGTNGLPYRRPSFMRHLNSV